MILVTGAAGFIGYHVSRRLLEAGRAVVGVDSLNSYYDPALKRARLDALAGLAGFRFHEIDIASEGALENALPRNEARGIVHLAAQAGVRHSLTAPFDYERSNLAGHLRVLEYARHAPRLQHLVYASSSSVYGDRSDGPFRETDRCDAPASLYAATKRSCELMSETYARLFGIKQTGLRFFTAYGPFGRPDMAYWSFTEKVLKGETLTLYGEGKLARDFTYIDDMAPAIIAALDHPPADDPPHVVVNLGNSNPSTVNDLVAAVEKATGMVAKKEFAPRNAVEVSATFADVTRAKARYGFEPRVSLEEGVARFVRWYKGFYGV
ncbi:MAG: NAD-dependent epimerase/dehydratase family protein [Alphaproteobacteria bacterium]|nr:NAD-dependent epimerase/dehydratase family protein [Alphaproteobacteria bacterium]